MIRHLVMWKLQATDAEGKAAAVAAIAAALEPLIDVIPGIQTLTVHALDRMKTLRRPQGI